jgi:hypothetical protein
VDAVVAPLSSPSVLHNSCSWEHFVEESNINVQTWH